MIGKTLGHYRILEELGSGGMGEVYRAQDTRLERDVALKILPPEMAKDPELRKRFEREAKAIAALKHPHIVTIHSVEESDGLHFLTMELVNGQMLSDISPEGNLSLARFFELALPLANAVASATPPDADLFTLFRNWHSLEVYLERPIVRENSDKSLRRRLASDRAVYVVMDENIYAPRSNLFRRVVSRFDHLTGQSETVILASN